MSLVKLLLVLGILFISPFLPIISSFLLGVFFHLAPSLGLRLVEVFNNLMHGHNVLDLVLQVVRALLGIAMEVSWVGLVLPRRTKDQVNVRELYLNAFREKT